MEEEVLLLIKIVLSPTFKAKLPHPKGDSVLHKRNGKVEQTGSFRIMQEQSQYTNSRYHGCPSNAPSCFAGRHPMATAANGGVNLPEMMVMTNSFESGSHSTEDL